MRNGLDAADQLDTIMHNKYAHDAANLRAWLVANHTERPPAPRHQARPVEADEITEQLTRPTRHHWFA